MVEAYDEIDRLAHEVYESVVEWRHLIHQNPELSNREEKTAAFVKDKLNSFGIQDVKDGIAGHGIVAVLHGDRQGSRAVIALRADMDALPVKEMVDVPFASNVVDHAYPGGPFPVAHACGHDCHTSALLGAAFVLSKLRERISGTVLFVFQPAEEGPPVTEKGGARQMLEEGAFNDIQPSMAFGLHVGPLPKGFVGYRSGVQFAASCLVKVTVNGEQVHASTPWQGVDPMPACGAIMTNVGQLYRQFDAFDSLTISFGHVDDVGRFNIIGERVTIWGTIRTTSDHLLPDIQAKLRSFVRSTAKSFGCTAEAEFMQNVPPVHNTDEWMHAALPTLKRTMGDDKVVRVHPNMAYDDVAELINRFGGVYVMLGAQDVEYDAKTESFSATRDGRGMVPNHNPRFYADDQALLDAVRLYVNVAVDHLGGRLTKHA